MLGLLLPAAKNIKIMVFSDCRLDIDMLRLLVNGLAHDCSVESLQIEWNTFELPLPSVEAMEAEDAARAAEAGDVADGSGSADDGETEVKQYDLEFRERRRYALQSQRILHTFRNRLADLYGGSIGAAFEALEVPGDADRRQ